MRINRKQFLGVAAGSGAGLVLAACGGGGYGGSTPASSCGSTIATNHGHTLPIAVADVNSTVDKSYDITGAATHSHSVTLTAQQLAQLKAGTAVSVTSTAGGTDGHTHAVAVNCTIY
jgi:hypothetical protein